MKKKKKKSKATNRAKSVDWLIAQVTLSVLRDLESLPLNDAGERVIPAGGLDKARNVIAAHEAIYDLPDSDAVTGTSDDQKYSNIPTQDFGAIADVLLKQMTTMRSAHLAELDQSMRDIREGRTLPLEPMLEGVKEEDARWLEIKGLREHVVVLMEHLKSLYDNWSNVSMGGGDAGHARMCAMAQAKQLINNALLSAWTYIPTEELILLREDLHEQLKYRGLCLGGERLPKEFTARMRRNQQELDRLKKKSTATKPDVLH